MKPSLSRRLLGWMPAVVLMVVIFIESSHPAPEIIRHRYVPLQDKWLHLLCYFILAALFLRALIWEGRPWSRKTAWLAGGLSILYGLSDEIHQMFVPARSADLSDWVADTLGALLVVVFLHQLRRLIEWEIGAWDKSSDR